MPANKGIINWIDTRLWSEDMLRELEGILYKFPEYPYRAVKMPNPLIPSFLAGGLSHLKTPNPLKIDTGREICVYIPLLPQAAHFRISYEFIAPFPEGIRFCYKVFFNGRHVVSGDVTPRKEVRGSIANAIEVDLGCHNDKKIQYESKSFAFAAEKPGRFKSRAEDGGLIEVRWFRIEGTKPSEPEGLQPTKSLKSKYGISFQSTGPPATLKYRDILLKDPESEPYAVFKFFYRTMESMREHSIVTEDENGEIIPHATMIGGAESSLRSFFPGAHLPRDATSLLNSGLSAIPEGAVAGAQVDDSLVDLDVLHTIRGRLRANSGSQRRSFEGGNVPRRGTTATTRSHSFDPLNGGQRRRPSTVASPRDNSDSNKSLMSLTPSLKAALDAEDSDKTIDDVVATAQRTHVDRLYIPKRRRPHASVSHTGISGQVEDLTVDDDDSDDDSMIGDPTREDSTLAITFLSPAPRAAGMYQHDNTGLPRGESDYDSSNPDLDSLEFSSVIDDEFAASGFAPPTMAVPISSSSRRRLSLDCFSPAPDNTGAAVDSSPIKTPGGHDFPVISPTITPKLGPALNAIESSPIKTPGGGDFPVDPPGSEGFPVMEPGEFVGLSPGEMFEESEPAASSEAGEGSVIHHTAPRVKAKSNSLPKSRKHYKPLLSPSLAARSRNFSSPPHHPSSPAEEIQQPRPVTEGGVQRRISQYELPGDTAIPGRRDSIGVPPGRVASPSVVLTEVGGETAHAKPGGSYGKVKATPSLIALQEKQEKQDKTMDEAKCVISAVKSKIGFIMERRGAKGATGGEVSGDKEMEGDDLNGTFDIDDDDIVSSSPANFVSRSPKKLGGKQKATEDDVFSLSATQVATHHSRKSSCEDDPTHPLRRRQSLSKATYRAWMATSHKKKASFSKLSMEGAAPKMLPLVEHGDSEQIAAMSAPRLNENIIVGSVFVSNDAFDGPVVWNDADRRLGNDSPNNDPPTAPASLHNFPVATPVVAPVSSSSVAGSADANGSRQPPRVFDYPSRVRAIDPPSEILNSDEETPAGFTSNDASFFDVSVRRFIEVADDMRRDGTAIRERFEGSLQAAYDGANPAQGVQADRGAVIRGAAVTAASDASTNPFTTRPPSYQETRVDAGDGNVSIEAEQTDEQQQRDEQRHAQQHQQAIWDSMTAAPVASPSLEGNANANPLNIGLTEYQGAQQDPWTPTQRLKRETDAQYRLPPLASELGFEAEYDQRVQIERPMRYDGGVASPGAEASGSAQHDQSSPATPRGPAPAATLFPPRSSSLRHATRAAPIGQNVTPTRTALNGVPAPAIVPPPSQGGAGPPVYQGLQANPLRQPSPMRRSSLLEREHPLGSPLTRSPSSTFSGQDRRGVRFTPSTTDTNVSAAGVTIRNTSNAGDMFNNSPVRLVHGASLPSHLRLEVRNSTPMPGAWVDSPTKSDLGGGGEWGGGGVGMREEGDGLEGE